MSRVVALITTFTLLVATLPAVAKNDPNATLKLFITTPFTSNTESKTMAKNLISEYAQAPINVQSMAESTDDAIMTVGFDRVELTPQIRRLVKDLDGSLGKRIAQNPFMQQNLSNLLREMRGTFESNARMNQESAHTLRFGAVYWTIVLSSLFFSYHVAGVIERTGHDVYGLVANVSLLLSTAAVTAFAMGKTWKSPSERNPKPELAQWENELIKDINESHLKYCKIALTL